MMSAPLSNTDPPACPPLPVTSMVPAVNGEFASENTPGAPSITVPPADVSSIRPATLFIVCARSRPEA